MWFVFKIEEEFMKRLVKKSRFLICVCLFVLVSCSQDKELVQIKQNRNYKSIPAIRVDTIVSEENLSLDEDTIPEQMEVVTLFSRG
jgi:hypothetical protein